jgi:hypothetical protein
VYLPAVRGCDEETRAGLQHNVAGGNRESTKCRQYPTTSPPATQTDTGWVEKTNSLASGDGRILPAYYLLLERQVTHMIPLPEELRRFFGEAILVQ